MGSWLSGDLIGVEDFLKIELRVGEINGAESVPESDKLIIMKVDFGEHGKRTILAGIAKSYQPSDLIGKQAVFVVNLKMLKKYES